MTYHTPLTHCRALHGTPSTRALDALIAKACAAEAAPKPGEWGASS